MVLVVRDPGSLSAGLLLMQIVADAMKDAVASRKGGVV